MKKKDAEKLAIFFVVVAVLVMLHQLFTWGPAFEMSDLHHETWIIAGVALAIGLWLGSRR